MTIILLMTPRTYRARPFLAAAKKLGLDAICAVDLPPELASTWNLDLAIDLRDPDAATRSLLDYAARHPVQAILAIDDAASLVAAQASAQLNLPHNLPQAALAARDKLHMRQALQAGGVRNPAFAAYPLHSDPAALAAEAPYPCVLKPLLLNGSRGVIRANNPAEFIAAWQTITLIIQQSAGEQIMIEAYIPGSEVALEGILTPNGLKVLALFDKPDPLEGPYFEETIYVTPSRLPASTQQAIHQTTAQAAHALGLRTGPIHAELRINQDGPWIVEIAGRSIGGLCSATLQFGPGISLEELILCQAVGQPIDDLTREHASRGVMMIPIPQRGILREVRGIEAAQAVPGIESIEITAKRYYPVIPLPEGDSYLGFIFAHGEHPAEVEAALRAAHAHLDFTIEPEIILHVGPLTPQP